MTEKGRSDLLSSFKTSPKLLKAVKGMKDAKDPNARPDIPDGNFVAKFHSLTPGARKGIPSLRLRFTVSRGPYTGTLLSKTYDLGITKPDPKRSEEEETEFVDSILGRCAIDLSRMGAKTSIDSPENLLKAVDEVNAIAPTMDITVKSGATGYLNVYVNRVVKDESPAPVLDEDEGEEDDDALEVVVGDDDDDDKPETDDSETVPPVEVGDVVRYKPKGAKQPVKFEVTKSDSEKRICTLKDSSGGLVKGVSWDKVGFVFDTNPS